MVAHHLDLYGHLFLRVFIYIVRYHLDFMFVVREFGAYLLRKPYVANPYTLLIPLLLDTLETLVGEFRYKQRQVTCSA